MRHPSTPGLAKVLLGAAVGYALLPFDLIPDFMPVIGHVDDLVIVPLLVILAMRLIPKGVVVECRSAGEASRRRPKRMTPTFPRKPSGVDPPKGRW